MRQPAAKACAGLLALGCLLLDHCFGQKRKKQAEFRSDIPCTARPASIILRFGTGPTTGSCARLGCWFLFSLGCGFSYRASARISFPRTKAFQAFSSWAPGCVCVCVCVCACGCERFYCRPVYMTEIAAKSAEIRSAIPHVIAGCRRAAVVQVDRCRNSLLMLTPPPLSLQ